MSQSSPQDETEEVSLLIYGSCVSRDMLEFVVPVATTLRGYIARQSWISIASPVATEAFEPTSLSSPFAERSYRGDLTGDALKQIRSIGTKRPGSVLLMDLVDERGGVFRHLDGSVVTNAFGSPAADQLHSATHSERGQEDWRFLRFGTLDHFSAFTDAAVTLKDRLREMRLFDRSIVLKTRWAEFDSDNNATSPSFGVTASAANEIYEDYFDLLGELGFHMAVPEISGPTADPNHKWGPAPFHYTSDYYRSLWDALSPYIVPPNYEGAKTAISR